VSWAPAAIKPPLKMAVMSAVTVDGRRGGNARHGGARSRSSLIAQSAMDARYSPSTTRQSSASSLAYVARASPRRPSHLFG
jgi:hypothetical protein